MNTHLFYFLLVMALCQTATAQNETTFHLPDSTKPKPQPEVWDAALPKPEKDAVYPGGHKAWTRYIIEELDMLVAMRKNAPAGIYNVIIEYDIDSTGRTANFKPITNHGYGMEKEAIRVLKKSKRWEPATMAGKNVSVTKRYSVRFEIN